MNEPEFIEEQDKLQKELDELKEQMALHSIPRNEAKIIRARIQTI